MTRDAEGEDGKKKNNKDGGARSERRLEALSTHPKTGGQCGLIGERYSAGWGKRRPQSRPPLVRWSKARSDWRRRG
ncbi:hypothetical protein chiPu_0031025 [Chiloscyllium punctatum]|uniref:Uncharacterized protein n=1 Tax=Chiloscyllium punctatum TaxID=137246 RepID=A0A401TV81_CHIPU|nr:hypothetical protein [Chiloscyllium punctatum]